MKQEIILSFFFILALLEDNLQHFNFSLSKSPLKFNIIKKKSLRRVIIKSLYKVPLFYIIINRHPTTPGQS